MAKKFKPKVVQKQEQQNNPSHSMMTEQEEKMFYANKKMALQNSHLSQIKKKNTTVNNTNYASNNDNDQQENIEHFQLSNLNQTSAQQITEFINKLIAKNKVTSRNAFDIPLIHLEQMEDFRSSLNENTWKRLSSTLENDYKIYGYRVDAAHTITYKMVQSIARHEAAGEETKMSGLSGVNKSTQVGKAKAGTTTNEILNSFMQTSFNENISRNKMNVDYTKFIQKNQKLINVTHIEAFFGCNPGLQKTKRKFDQQGLKALLLNNIALRNGCQLKLDQHRKYGLNDQNGKVKKENVENSNQIDTQQNEFQNQFNSMYQRIFNSMIPENKIQLENQQIQQSVFDQIYELNTSECKSNQDEYKKFQKLYKIISGQDRQEKRLLTKRKQENEMMIEEKNEVVESEVRNIDKGDTLERNENEFINKVDNVGQQSLNANDSKPLEQKHIQNDEKNYTNKVDQQLPNVVPNQNPLQVIPQSSTNDLTQNQSDIIHPSQPLHLQIIPQTISLQSYHQEKQQQQKNAQNQNQSHPLIDKNFQMHEMNLDRMQESSSSLLQQKQLSSIYSGKFKNIQEYIKIKQQKIKRQKKAKILIDDLTSEEIGKKLFNRKYKKKKSQLAKNQNLLKEESGINHLRKKVDFSKLTKPSNDLKRSVIFKKSVTQQRTFNQIKQKIKKKLEDRQKSKQYNGEQNNLKKSKGKKSTKIFDLPIYQFQSGDTNFIQPYEQIDPQTNQLEFSSFYKNYFPSFVQSSCKIIQEIRKKKQQKEKEANQLAQMKKNQQKEQQNQMMEQNLNLNQQNEGDHGHSEINVQNPQKHEEQQNDDHQPDISFIGDQMGQFRGKNQVAIRDAKQKVRKIILQMFFNLKSRKLKSKKQKKISFKEIYEAYYRKQGFISPALCFLTILHLANEHNLVLEGKQDGTDFKIYVQEENQIAKQMKKNDFVMEIQPILEDCHPINKSVAQSISSSAKQEEKAQQDLIQEE